MRNLLTLKSPVEPLYDRKYPHYNSFHVLFHCHYIIPYIAKLMTASKFSAKLRMHPAAFSANKDLLISAPSIRVCQARVKCCQNKTRSCESNANCCNWHTYRHAHLFLGAFAVLSCAEMPLMLTSFLTAHFLHKSLFSCKLRSWA